MKGERAIMTIPPMRKRHPQAKALGKVFTQDSLKNAPPPNPRRVTWTSVEGHRCRACKTSSSDSASIVNHKAARPETTSHTGTQLQQTYGVADEDRTLETNSARHPYHTKELLGNDWKQPSLRREEHLRRGERAPHRRRALEEEQLKKRRTRSGVKGGREMQAPSSPPANRSRSAAPDQVRGSRHRSSCRRRQACAGEARRRRRPASTSLVGTEGRRPPPLRQPLVGSLPPVEVPDPAKGGPDPSTPRAGLGSSPSPPPGLVVA
uniref:Uncharacterized protein n=1 Tax=Oryza meridionalis TaxID=40149 RepID=A0A0E0DXC5_9ORYZ